MKTHVEKLDGNIVRLTVTVPADEVDVAIDAAYKSIAKKIKVPGFRAGKAPKPVIDTHVGREAVDRRCPRRAAHQELRRCTGRRGASVRSPSRRSASSSRMEPGKDFEFVAEVEVRPELELCPRSRASASPCPSKKATEREIDAQIDTMRERFATLEPVEDRGVAGGRLRAHLVRGQGRRRGVRGQHRRQVPLRDEPRAHACGVRRGTLGVEAGSRSGLSRSRFREHLEQPGVRGQDRDFRRHRSRDQGQGASRRSTMSSRSRWAVSTPSTSCASRHASSSTIRRRSASAERVEDNARRAIAERLEGDIPEAMIESTRGQMMRDFDERSARLAR